MIGIAIIAILLIAQTYKEEAQKIRKRYRALTFSQKKEYAEEMRK
jgi:hypothetical protein